MSNAFKVGDIVVSKNGTKPFKITSTGRYDTYGTYLHNNRYVSFNTNMIELYSGEVDTATSSKMTKEGLYSVDIEGILCQAKYVGTNSVGKHVMELVSNGAMITADKSIITEILPYTIETADLSNNYRKMHYKIKEGSVKVDDILLYKDEYNNYFFSRVTALNTKNRKAKEFKGSKVITQEI